MQAAALDNRTAASIPVLAAPVLLLSIVHALAMVDRTLFAAVAPAVRAGLGLDHAQLGWLLGPAFALGYAPAVLVLGRMADRIALVRLMVAGMAVWTIAGALTGLAGSVATLTAARWAMGVGQAAFVPAALLWVIAATPDERRPRAVSWFTAGSTAGRSSALLLAGALLGLLGTMGVAENRGWRTLLVVTALPNLLALVLLMRLPSPGRATVPVATGWLRGHWRMLAPFVAIALVPLFLNQMLSAWLPELAVLRWGLSTAAAASLVGAGALVGAPAGHLAGGWLLSKRPRWRERLPQLLVGTVLAALPCMLVIGWAPSVLGAGIGVVAVSFVLGVASFGGMFGVQERVPDGLRGTVTGIYLALVMLVALGGGPLLAGLLSSAGGGTSEALRAALVLITVGGAAVALALLGIEWRARRC